MFLKNLLKFSIKVCVVINVNTKNLKKFIVFILNCYLEDVKCKFKRK